MITGGDLRQSRLDVGYKTFTISPWEVVKKTKRVTDHSISIFQLSKKEIHSHVAYQNQSYFSDIQ